MALLPVAETPFAAPTDRDMLPSERRAFVLTQRTCVFGFARQKDGPAMSIVYYVPDDNGMLHVATMAGRLVLKCKPYATFAAPPRHLHTNDQDEKITHWLSGQVPWSADDPA